MRRACRRRLGGAELPSPPGARDRLHAALRPRRGCCSRSARSPVALVRGRCFAIPPVAPLWRRTLSTAARDRAARAAVAARSCPVLERRKGCLRRGPAARLRARIARKSMQPPERCGGIAARRGGSSASRAIVASALPARSARRRGVASPPRCSATWRRQGDIATRPRSRDRVRRARAAGRERRP